MKCRFTAHGAQTCRLRPIEDTHWRQRRLCLHCTRRSKWYTGRGTVPPGAVWSDWRTDRGRRQSSAAVQTARLVHENRRPLSVVADVPANERLQDVPLVRPRSPKRQGYRRRSENRSGPQTKQSEVLHRLLSDGNARPGARNCHTRRLETNDGGFDWYRRPSTRRRRRYQCRN